MTKVEQAVQAFDTGNKEQALKIAKTFKMGVTEAERKQIARGFECTHSEAFYRMIGFIPRDEIDKALQIFKAKIYEPYKRNKESKSSCS